jgi:PAP2 superfamily
MRSTRITHIASRTPVREPVRGLSRLICTCVCLAVAGAYVDSARAGDFVESSGDVLRVAIPAYALALTIKRHDKQGRRQFYKGFAVNFAATWALKEIVDKERPNGEGQDAFPSGHSSMAFQGAAFIHRRYGFRDAWPSYALATYTAWTRVDIGEHDRTDVLAGAALGIASSFLFAERMPGINVALGLDDGAIGIRFSGVLGAHRARPLTDPVRSKSASVH